jgi:hypothetical protein
MKLTVVNDSGITIMLYLRSTFMRGSRSGPGPCPLKCSELQTIDRPGAGPRLLPVIIGDDASVRRVCPGPITVFDYSMWRC